MVRGSHKFTREDLVANSGGRTLSALPRSTSSTAMKGAGWKVLLCAFAALDLRLRTKQVL